MGKEIINEPNPKDEELFKLMEYNYQSENEKKFFEQMRYKEENIYTSAFDPVVLENSNDDGLYLIRVDFDEYILGAGNGLQGLEIHTQSLADALSTNLKKIKLIKKNATLLEWLREKDYTCVVYDKNYDWL